MGLGLLCWARKVSGHAVTDPTIVLMKSRRRIAFSKALDRSDYRSQRILQQGFATDEMDFRVSLHGSNPEPLTSALGQKQTFVRFRVMSALPPKADIALFMSTGP
jgi:hypothetical protein